MHSVISKSARPLSHHGEVSFMSGQETIQPNMSLDHSPPVAALRLHCVVSGEFTCDAKLGWLLVPRRSI